MTTPTVHQAVAAVTRDIGAVAKDRTNQQQGFRFRGIDDVMNALHKPLADHGVVIVPEVLERIAESRATSGGKSMNVVHLRVRYTFYGPAGDSIAAEVWGEAQDSADKATNKALSAAMKYALLQVFCVPTEDLEDADASGDAAPVRSVKTSGSQGESKGKAHSPAARTSTPEPAAPAPRGAGSGLSAAPGQDGTGPAPAAASTDTGNARLLMFQETCRAFGMQGTEAVEALIKLGWTFHDPQRWWKEVAAWSDEDVREACDTLESGLADPPDPAETVQAEAS